MKRFLEWSGKTVEDLNKLSIKEARHLLLQFQGDMKSQEERNNTILAIITSVRSFFVYLEKPIKFRRGQLVKQQMATRGYHHFSNGDLGQMYNTGGAFEKALLATGVSLGWEVSAILDIDRKDFKRFVERARKEKKEFFTFAIQREKTGAHRLGILNPLALEALERYFAVNKDETEKLFPLTSLGANKVLRRLAREANIALTGPIRFHELRSWLMSKLSRADFNEFQIKYIMGKTIPLTDLTYLNTLQAEIEEKYPEAYKKHLSILKYQTKNQTGEIESLKAEVERLKQLVRGMTEMYGEEIAEKAAKRLGKQRLKKISSTRTMTRAEKMLMIIAQETEPIED